MTRPLILPLALCTDPGLVGGKALGLARLVAAGFPVPSGICVTTEAYGQSLQAQGFALLDEWQKANGLSGERRPLVLSNCQSRIRQADIPQLAAQCTAVLQTLGCPSSTRWAVRSSATNEDTARASFAGLYRSKLGVSSGDLDAAIKEVWASIWDERVVAYHAKSGTPTEPPAMAVVIQPMVDAAAAGVAYSIHPVTGRSHQVVIDALFGLAAPLVDGQATPDHFVVETDAEGEPVGLSKRVLADKPERLSADEEGLHHDPVPKARRTESSLSHDQLLSLARIVKRVERSFGCPVDVEWAFDARQLWLLQARPITAIHPVSELTNEDCEWSRANFKETMPEVPSPMGRSFLETFMDAYIIAQYRRVGCRIPAGVSSVRVLEGRPYLNVSLFHLIVGQLGGDTSLLAEQLGGEALVRPPFVKQMTGLRLARAAALIFIEMRRVEKGGPRWFSDMKQLSTTYRRDRIGQYSLAELARHLDELGRWLDPREATFGIAAGVGQCLQTFSLLLPRWLGEDWRNLLNAALQGQGTVISAQQIMRLAELVMMARADAAVTSLLLRDGSDNGSYREQLQGTGFLASFDRYVEDYGHRGLGESDVMSPRFADQPELLLDIMKVQLRGPDQTPVDIAQRQRKAREKAMATIRDRCGWRIDRWVIFGWWYRRLCRFFSLREANRHHLMYYSTAARNLLLRFGERLVEQGIFNRRDDVFFLTMQERADLMSATTQDWAALVESRRTEWKQWHKVAVPDTIREWEEAVRGSNNQTPIGPDGTINGISISPGVVTGPARLVRSASDWSKVASGDIIVAPVIDPGMAPLFGIAGGLIVEMGGTLSHGAIIAREYGLPTVANVERAMTRLQEGQRVTLDAGAGTIHSESCRELRNP